MLQADYHRESGLVAAFVDDTTWPPYRPTGAPVPDGAPLERLDVRTVWPDPYVERYPHLLGRAHVLLDAAADVLVRTFPDADTSPQALRAAIGEDLDASARLALGASDWAVVRRADTGAEVPAAVARQRAALRAWHDDRRSTLAAATPGDLLGFDVSPPEDLRTTPPRR